MSAKIRNAVFLLLLLINPPAHAEQESAWATQEPQRTTVSTAIEERGTTIGQSKFSAEGDTSIDARQALTDAKRESNASAIIKYVGNTGSHIFHRPSCPFAQAMDPGHRVSFRFRHDAIDRDFVPCRYCLPPVWLSVHAVLLIKPKRSP